MEQLPVIDLTAPHDEMVQAVTAACREWGFFQVVQHGIPDETFAAFDNAMRTFFALPDQVKRNLKRHEGNPRGWFNDELTKQTRDWKECVDIGRDKVSDIDGQNQWQVLCLGCPRARMYLHAIVPTNDKYTPCMPLLTISDPRVGQTKRHVQAFERQFRPTSINALRLAIDCWRSAHSVLGFRQISLKKVAWQVHDVVLGSIFLCTMR